MSPYEIYTKNLQNLESTDTIAKKQGKLVGRYISHPYADGYAYYRITKENKKTVHIEVVTGLGDDWVLPAWGDETTIDKNLALRFIICRDAFSELVNS
jgi:hypothetical protein